MNVSNATHCRTRPDSCLGHLQGLRRTLTFETPCPHGHSLIPSECLRVTTSTLSIVSDVPFYCGPDAQYISSDTCDRFCATLDDQSTKTLKADQQALGETHKHLLKIVTSSSRDCYLPWVLRTKAGISVMAEFEQSTASSKS